MINLPPYTRSGNGFTIPTFNFTQLIVDTSLSTDILSNLSTPPHPRTPGYNNSSRIPLSSFIDIGLPILDPIRQYLITWQHSMWLYVNKLNPAYKSLSMSYNLSILPIPKGTFVSTYGTGNHTFYIQTNLGNMLQEGDITWGPTLTLIPKNYIPISNLYRQIVGTVFSPSTSPLVNMVSEDYGNDATHELLNLGAIMYPSSVDDKFLSINDKTPSPIRGFTIQYADVAETARFTTQGDYLVYISVEYPNSITPNYQMIPVYMHNGFHLVIERSF